MESRRNLFIGCAGVFLAVAAAGLAIGGRPELARMTRAGLRSHGHVRIHRQRAAASWDSENWGGYAISGASGAGLPDGSVTEVKGSWKVPAISACPSSGSADADAYSSFWTGMDGWASNSETVEQIGTDSDCVSLDGTKTDTPTYYAWYEFYPQNSYVIEFPKGCSSPAEAKDTVRVGTTPTTCVEPGDTISAEVTWSNGSSSLRAGPGHASASEGTFALKLTDVTRNWTFTETASLRGARESSAEWITEAPCCTNSGGFLPLADFSSVGYGDYYTKVADTSWATISGNTAPLGSFGSDIQDITIVNETTSAPMAYPSVLLTDSLGNPSNFNMTWESVGP